MASLKIRIYKNDNPVPDQTVTIPLGIIKMAEKIIPAKARAAMEEKGVDIRAIAEAAKSDEMSGVIVEVEDHISKEKTVISIE